MLSGPNHLIGVESKTGKQLWDVELSCSSVASTACVDGEIFVPAKGLKVYTLESAGKAPTMSWESNRLTPSSSSMLVTPLGVVGLNRSILVCCESEGESKGKRRWNARLEDAGQIWATPVVAGDHLYAFGMSGKCFTVELGEDSAEVVKTSELGADVLGSPAIDDGALFVRSVDALWRISSDQ